MKEALKVINDMRSEGIVKDYAIGGTIAVIFHTEPILTSDLDIIFVPAEDDDTLLALRPLYEYLERRGYSPEKEYVIVEGVVVQFIPVYNNLVMEAVENSESILYDSEVKTKVIAAEYMVAILAQTGRDKDKERLKKMLEDASIDNKKLEKILYKYDLTIEGN